MLADCSGGMFENLFYDISHDVSMCAVFMKASKFLFRVRMANCAIEKSSQISRHDLAMVWLPLIIDRLQERVNLNMPASKSIKKSELVGFIAA